MADEILRSIYSAADETVAQLDQLHRASQERARATRLSLDAAVARLGDSSLPFVDGNAYGSQEPLSEPAPPRPRPVVDETPYFPLPERTSHGGPFGPAVRAKLLAAALAKDTRW
jgi:hypothetical protein